MKESEMTSTSKSLACWKHFYSISICRLWSIIKPTLSALQLLKGGHTHQDSNYICHHNYLWLQHKCQPGGIEEEGRPGSAPRARLLPSMLSLPFSHPRCGSPALFASHFKKSSISSFSRHLGSCISRSLSLGGHHSLHFSSQAHILDFHPGAMQMKEL